MELLFAAITGFIAGMVGTSLVLLYVFGRVKKEMGPILAMGKMMQQPQGFQKYSDEQ